MAVIWNVTVYRGDRLNVSNRILHGADSRICGEGTVLHHLSTFLVFQKQYSKSYVDVWGSTTLANFCTFAASNIGCC